MKVYVVVAEHNDYSGDVYFSIVKIFSVEAAATHHCDVLLEKNDCTRTFYNVEEWSVE